MSYDGVANPTNNNPLVLTIAPSGYVQASDDFYNYIENHPQALIKQLVHRDRVVTITKAEGCKVVTSGGHRFLLHKSQKNTAVDFLLQAIYKKPPGFSVSSYEPPNDVYGRMYEKLQGLSDFIVKPIGPGKTCLSGLTNNKGVLVKYNKKDDTIEYVELEYQDNLALKGKEIFRAKVGVKSDKETDLSRKRINLIHNKKPIDNSFVVRNSFFPDVKKEASKKRKREEVDKTVERIIKDWNEQQDSHIMDISGFELVSSPDTSIKTEFAEIFNTDLDSFIDEAFNNIQNDCINIYGVNIPTDVFVTSKFDGSTNSFSWEDKNGKLDCPTPNLPAAISPEGKLFYFQNGFLHRESGPAVQSLYDKREDEWSLWGVKVSKEEFDHYVPNKKAIIFRNEKGKIHRDDGPALSYFDIENGYLVQDYYSNGIMSYSVHQSLNSQIKSNKRTNIVATTPKIKYSELSDEDVNALKAIFRENIDHLRKYEADIRKAANKAMINKGIITEEESSPLPKKRVARAVKRTTSEENMTATLDERKKIRSAPDREGTRTNQVVNGFKFGFKKGIVNNGSNAFAKKVATLTPLEGNEWFERFLQVVFLIGAAEMIERMPDGMAEKARMSEEFRLNAASLCRYISGENLGRDAVDIAVNVLPLFKEVLMNVTAEEFADLAQDLDAQQEADDVFDETVFSHEEEEVKVEQFEEVTA